MSPLVEGVDRERDREPVDVAVGAVLPDEPGHLVGEQPVLSVADLLEHAGRAVEPGRLSGECERLVADGAADRGPRPPERLRRGERAEPEQVVPDGERQAAVGRAVGGEDGAGVERRGDLARLGFRERAAPVVPTVAGHRGRERLDRRPLGPDVLGLHERADERGALDPLAPGADAVGEPAPGLLERRLGQDGLAGPALDAQEVPPVPAPDRRRDGPDVEPEGGLGDGVVEVPVPDLAEQPGLDRRDVRREHLVGEVDEVATGRERRRGGGGLVTRAEEQVAEHDALGPERERGLQLRLGRLAEPVEHALFVPLAAGHVAGDPVGLGRERGAVGEAEPPAFVGQERRLDEAAEVGRPACGRVRRPGRHETAGVRVEEPGLRDRYAVDDGDRTALGVGRAAGGAVGRDGLGRHGGREGEGQERGGQGPGGGKRHQKWTRRSMTLAVSKYWDGT